MFASEPQNDENPKPLADIVREETNDGRLIVRFLIEVMQGQIDDSKPWHRLDAARQLLNLGFSGARNVIQSVSQSAGVRAPSSAPGNARFDQGIADIIKLETSDGRDAVRFLVDVMQGNLQDFKPHHRPQLQKSYSDEDSTTPPVTVTTNTQTKTNRSTKTTPGLPNSVTPTAPTTSTATLTCTTKKTTRSTSRTTMKSNTGTTETAAGP